MKEVVKINNSNDITTNPNNVISLFLIRRNNEITNDTSIKANATNDINNISILKKDTDI